AGGVAGDPTPRGRRGRPRAPRARPAFHLADGVHGAGVSFPVVIQERVRFRDCDSLGHVNNAVYLTYLEEARVELLTRFDMSWTEMILARCEIDFRDQVSVGEIVEVSLWPTRVGNKSFELGYELKV